MMYLNPLKDVWPYLNKEHRETDPHQHSENDNEHASDPVRLRRLEQQKRERAEERCCNDPEKKVLKRVEVECEHQNE